MVQAATDLNPSGESEPIGFVETTPQPIQEQIGAQRRTYIRTSGVFWQNWIDSNRSDYAYWDKTRRAKSRGLELASLLLKPLTSKAASWVLGRPPMWQLPNKKIAQELNDWWRVQHPSILRAYEESLNLGDCYLVFNGDTSLTVVPPNAVEPILDQDNYQRRIGWRITTTYSEDGDDRRYSYKKMTIVDEYYADVHTRRLVGDNGATLGTVQRFPNRLGMIPVVKVSNILGADELYGRPEGEPLIPAMIRYNDVFETALKGNIRQGRPTPVISKIGTDAQLRSFRDIYGSTETRTNADGTSETIDVIDFDPDILVTLGGTAEFSYESPKSFSSDTIAFLGILFYLMVQFSEIPEAFWGNALNASKASSESQLEPFIKWIEKKRGLGMAWIQQVADLYLAYVAVYNRRARGLKATAMWKPMTSAEGRLVLDADIWLYAKKLLDPQMATWLSPLNFDDPSVVADRAKDYWGAEYGQPAAAVAGNAPPASGGGQQNFTKQEKPIQPTERQQQTQQVHQIAIGHNLYEFDRTLENGDLRFRFLRDDYEEADPASEMEAEPV